MDKKIIVKVAAGLGNQMFMYANALSLSNRFNYKLFIDNTSGFFQNKNKTFGREYGLNIFNISANLAENTDKYDNYLSHNYKKMLKFLNKYQKKKSFLTDPKGIGKKTFYEKIDYLLTNKVYLEGYFESEKYFFDLKSKLIEEFKIKENFIDKNNKYINLLTESNSVSIHIRRNRFVEPQYFKNRGTEPKKDMRLQDIINYINKAVSHFENKIDKPKFFIWSNDFSDLDKIFDKNKFIFVENNNHIIDFYLFGFAKHFIVSPSSFHWWGAWLNQNPNKICIRPSDNLNPSNNKDFWPDSWAII
mgnify:FL=1|tara:strand:+ start:631 stop:1539 length:909 start_codon:yes stop_codon:yes gene_type:complete